MKNKVLSHQIGLSISLIYEDFWKDLELIFYFWSSPFLYTIFKQVFSMKLINSFRKSILLIVVFNIPFWNSINLCIVWMNEFQQMKNLLIRLINWIICSTERTIWLVCWTNISMKSTFKRWIRKRTIPMKICLISWVCYFSWSKWKNLKWLLILFKGISKWSLNHLKFF